MVHSLSLSAKPTLQLVAIVIDARIAVVIFRARPRPPWIKAGVEDHPDAVDKAARMSAPPLKAVMVPTAMPTRQLPGVNMIAPVARQIVRATYIANISLRICVGRVICNSATIVSCVMTGVDGATWCERPHWCCGVISRRHSGVSCIAAAMKAAAGESAEAATMRSRICLCDQNRANQQR